MNFKPIMTNQKKSMTTPYAHDKKTPNFAQGLDFLKSQVAIYTVVFMRNPNLRSENVEF